jgi:serine/threonine protein kinase
MKYCPVCERNYGDEAGVCDVDGSILRDSAPKQDAFIGKIIKHRYRVLEKLGEGGMSVVYLAEQINIERKVALKVLHGEYARDEAFVRRFRQEAKLAASLNHRNVIQIFDFDQAEDGNLFIAMEHLVGKNLKEVIRADALDIPRAVRLGIQIADGLSAAHRAGVIHRDIKPENIMVVGRGDEIKLMDFGIARLREAGTSTRLTRAGMIMGTPAYMAPEQIEGNEINEKTDVYAFGIVLYETLSKTVPFTAPTPAAILMKHLKETPVPLRKLRREIPGQLEHIVTQALEKKPELRPSNMEDIAEALRKVERKVAPAAINKTLMATQPLEMINREATRGRSGFRVLLGKFLPGLRAREKAPAVGRSEDAPLSFSQDVSTLTSGEMGSPSNTVFETMPLTRPLESIQPKRMAWKWLALGGGTLFLGLLALWVAAALYRQGPNSERETVTASREPAVVSPLPAKIVSVVIAADRPELVVREQTGLRLVAQYADGAKEEIKEGVQWSSSDPSVLLVDRAGRVEAREVGKADVVARYKGMEAPAATIIVTQPSLPSPAPVSAPRLVSMRIQAGKSDLSARDIMFLRLRGKYSDGQEREVKKGVQWESSDRSIAAVNAKGEVLGLKEGRVEVLARAGEITSEPLSLVVKPAIIRGREPEAIKDLPLSKPSSRARETEAPKSVPPAKSPDLNEYIRVARSYRERGEYALALAELKKAGALDPKSKDVQGEIGITKRACHAEQTLGRSDLKCEP